MVRLGVRRRRVPKLKADAYQCCRLIVSPRPVSAILTSRLDNDALAGNEDALLLSMLNHTLNPLAKEHPDVTVAHLGNTILDAATGGHELALAD